jgi:hypothetical protein
MAIGVPPGPTAARAVLGDARPQILDALTQRAMPGMVSHANGNTGRGGQARDSVVKARS